jgi:glycosyltransferase involved in cell wall biosynthesis
MAAPGDPQSGRRLAGADSYILAVGTIEPRKDLPTLVRSFADLVLADTGDDVRLIIAGPDGWGLEALTDAIDACPPSVSKRIRRLGWVDDSQRADLLAGASVVAYPSLYEGFGLVPLEAMAAGVPVVTTSVGALPETVGDAALLVPPGDTDALGDAIGRVLRDDELADRLRTAGHERLNEFSWEATTDGLVDLYRRAMEDRASPGRPG